MHKAMEHRGVSLVQKGDWRVWWHYFVPAFFWVWGVFSPRVREEFYSNYWTVLGRHIYVPDLERVNTDLHAYAHIVFHELMHVEDDIAHPVRFKVSYITRKRARAHWEYRAVAQEFAALHALYGAVPAWNIAQRADNFTSAMYWHMDMDPMPVLERIVVALEGGELSLESMGSLEEILADAYVRRAA